MTATNAGKAPTHGLFSSPRLLQLDELTLQQIEKAKALCKDVGLGVGGVVAVAVRPEQLIPKSLSEALKDENIVALTCLS